RRVQPRQTGRSRRFDRAQRTPTRPDLLQRRTGRGPPGSAEALLELSGQDCGNERRHTAREALRLQRPAARVLVGEDDEERALEQAAIEGRLRFRRARALAAPYLEEDQRGCAPRGEKPARRLRVHHVVERFAPQLRRGTQPLGVTGQQLETEPPLFPGTTVAEGSG